MHRTFVFFVCPVFCACGRGTCTSRKKIVLKVKEMNCQLCAYLVNKELRNIDGVISTKASIKDGTVTVVEDPKVPDEQLINAIHKLNYTAEVGEVI